MRSLKWRILVVLVVGFGLNLCFAHEGLHSGSCPSAVHESHAHHHCDHGSHSHHHSHHHHHHHHPSEEKVTMPKLPEELAEEEDLKLYGIGSHYDHHHSHDHDHDTHEHGLSGVGLWVHAMGCSLL